MAGRYLSIWFPYLKTDRATMRRPDLKSCPVVMKGAERGRMVVKAANALAAAQGIVAGMPVADAKAVAPSLEALDDVAGMEEKLLHALGVWSIRYAPVAAVDRPDGLMLDVTGCAHLWGGEEAYCQEICDRLLRAGYTVRTGLASTTGAAWAMARWGEHPRIAAPGEHVSAMMSMPPSALRLSIDVLEKLHKLGLDQVQQLMGLPRGSLGRRFGDELLLRLDEAMGRAEVCLQPVQPVPEYEQRLPCLEPIITRAGIEIALLRLLETLCQRLAAQGKGVRKLIFRAYKLDGRVQALDIGTTRSSHHCAHLFKLFEEKLSAMAPLPGIELFQLEAMRVEDCRSVQEKIWQGPCGLDSIPLAELLDRIVSRIEGVHIRRWLPAEHYWPERSIREAATLTETSASSWQTERPRPVQLLEKPLPVQVTAPIPDYPPMVFIAQGKVHRIRRADGPERIEREWWLEEGTLRDYYIVEDEEGKRYWLFRAGYYAEDKPPQWYIHGYFA